MALTKYDKEYIQYSKKVTRWGLILITTVIMICLGIVAFCGLPDYSVSAVVSMYTAFATVLGVTIGAYQGNSSLEKYSRAKFQYEELLADEAEPAENTAG